MTQKNQTTINLAYDLESLLRILSLAVDGSEISGRTFENGGGGAVLGMAADMAGNLIEALELAEKSGGVKAFDICQ